MEFIRSQLARFGISSQTVDYLSNTIMVIFIAGVCILVNYIAKKIVLKVIIHIITNNRYTWDNIILEKKVFHKISHIVPAIILYYSGAVFPVYQYWIEKGALTYMMIVTIAILNALLNAFDDIYRSFAISKVRPIKGYIQVVKIILFIIGSIVIISNLIGQNPLIILSGLGALSAVLMLIFKDSILGLVAGIQLSSNDMVRVGDWIEMPKYNADGDVIDITLNTVKVMNFDKTITMIPSYALISDSFKNWRGMQVSGGRRIKRCIYIDTSSIHFCTEEMIEEFKKIHFLSEYITTRVSEIEEYNTDNQINTSNKVNGRQLTNIGVFRVYIHQYLKNHPKINKQMTLLVRQLAPGDSGLPMEIYAFSNDTDWAVYESIQSDIFDHIYAVAPALGIRLFQSPTGYDITQIERNPAHFGDENSQKWQKGM
ncbi:mechanosensitive ion channel family protein [Paenibacillus crassostreae]|uniref:Mechanosensing system component YbdG n=1 Tax=Paenibacillus crassostreae TaxID=1763538 RepID=A0A167GDG3_9BACL|nr:mechanosensitive ion channel domain-containing protein [Paenibacillus crassostreae]AOZ92696.1 mechanosensitive ion channel protein MscS [Paenibacillus crassostreae]OAB77468.1 mechanosensitive ion channel protein MscS [Paenibacillus crassostreae]